MTAKVFQREGQLTMDKAGQQPEGLTVALGGDYYRVRRGFGSFDCGEALVSDVACDDEGHVFVLLRTDPAVDTPRDPVVVLAEDGSFMRSFGNGHVADAHMLAVDGEGNVAVVDRDSHQVLFFDRQGNPTRRIGERNVPNAPFSHPSSVAFGPDGTFYVADGYGAQRIHRFAPSGHRIGHWGARGDGPGQFTTPHGLWILADGRVLVADRENDRVQVFSPEGTFLDAWRHLPRAMDIWGDGQGHIYVTDQVPSMSRFDAHGRLTGACRPVLNGAHGIWGDRQGRIYLAEVSPSRITRLEPTHRVSR